MKGTLPEVLPVLGKALALLYKNTALTYRETLRGTNQKGGGGVSAGSIAHQNKRSDGAKNF
jgi:hypothetical protein